jgi:hypothetical protein
MNVTLSMDEELIVRARRLADRKGTSLNQLIRDHLEALTALESRSTALEELETLWRNEAGDSKGERWTRDSLYDRAVLR